MEEQLITKIDYHRIHNWINYHHGKASSCIECNNTKNASRCEWALKDGFNHDYNIDNYEQLCSKCHRAKDYTEEHRSNQSKARIGKKHSKETLKKLKETNKGIHSRKKVMNTWTNEHHESITIAALNDEVSQSTIYRGLKDGRYEYI